VSKLQQALPDRASTLIQAMQDHTSVQKHRRRCKTRRLERTLKSLKSGPSAN